MINFSKVKRIKLKITSIIMLIMLLTLEFSPLAVKAAPNALQFYSAGTVSVARDVKYGKDVWYNIATLGGNTAYCIDYTCLNPSGTMVFRRYLSDQGMAVLMNGYPNVSAATLGVANIDEAYLATQMALWEVLNRTGESTKAGIPFRVENTQAKYGYEAFYERAAAAAKRLVSTAELNPYTSNPTLTINSTGNSENKGDYTVVGPFSANVTELGPGSLKSLKVSLEDAPSSARIVDADGNAKEYISNGEQVYVTVSNTEVKKTFYIRFTADVDKKVGVIYEKEYTNTQDYVTTISEATNLTDRVQLNWPGPSEELGMIKIIKVDQENEPVVGAKFQLTRDEDGADMGTFSTGTDGIVKIYQLKKGNYTLTEVEAPHGYQIKEKSKNVTVVANKTTDVTFVNNRIQGKIRINKTDDESKPVAGAKFEIYDSEKYIVDTITTDKDGKATSKFLDYGTYYFREVEAPAGYVLNDTLYTFNVENSTTNDAYVTNDVQRGTIVLHKVDDENKPIANVKFNILDENKNVVLTITTNEKGLAGAKNLKVGAYYYQEISAPEDVVMDTKIHPFTVEYNVNKVLPTIVNQRISGKLIIHKTNEEEKPVSGAVFEIYDESGKVVDTLTTAADGTASSKVLPKGKYTYKEISTPDEYVLDTKVYDFTISTNKQEVNRNHVNYLAKGKLQITKYDSNHKLLSGVKFEILDADKKVVDTITTDAEGKAITKDLPLGKYYYREVYAPETVEIDTVEYDFVLTYNNQVFKRSIVNDIIESRLRIIKIDEDNTPVEGVKFNVIDNEGKVIETIVTDKAGIAVSSKLLKGTYKFVEVEAPAKYVVNTKETTFEVVKKDQKIEYTVVNNFARGSLQITKIDSKGRLLENVKFEILNEAKEVVDTITTDKNGKAESKLLVLGKYTFREIAAPDYVVMNTKEQNFELNKNNEVVQKEVENKVKEGRLHIIKVDENNEPLEGVSFEIYDANMKLVDTITTNKDGVAESIDLEKGNYFYKEIKAPFGLIVDTTIYPFTIKEDGQNVIKNKVNFYAKGKLQIIKYDSNKDILEGVKFEILDSNKNVVDTIVTNKDGVAESKRLVIGRYTYREVEAPDNVIMDKEEHEFVLETNNQVVKEEVTNKIKEGKLHIIKVDENNEPLEGVSFEIYDANMKLVDTITTNKDGVAESIDLEKGSYFYKEVKAPEGIKVDDKLYEFTIEEDGQNVIKNMINYYMKGKLQIVKYDSNRTVIEGVKFEVRNSDNVVVDTIATNVNGIAMSKKLPVGNYTFKEIDAPDYVVMNTDEVSFKIESDNQILTKEVENKIKEGKLHIIKVDENNKPLEGVSFEIYDKDMNLVDTITTNKEGVAESKDLEKGKYYYKEVKAPEGIVIDETVYEFTIEEDGQNVIREMVNNYAKGQLQITKFDSNKKVLAGVKFEVLDANKNVVDTLITDMNGKAISKKLMLGKYTYREVEAPDYVVMDKDEHEFVLETNNQIVSKEVENKVKEGRLHIIKVDENEKPLEGVSFEIYDKDMNLVDTITTNKEGVAESKDLEKGKYYYKEIKAPEGIVIDETIHEFIIEEDGQNVIGYLVNNYAKATILITKVDTKNRVIEGVKFEIYNEKGEVVDIVVTDKNGKAESKKLLLGNYTFKEVDAPDYVVMSEEVYVVSLNMNNQQVKKTIENKIKEAKLHIIKVDENNKPLQGVTFKIYDKDMNHVDTIVTDKNGVAESKDLEKGDYFYQEIKAPKGIKVDDTIVPFTIEEDGQNVIKNIVNKFERGTLKIYKIAGDTNMPLANAKFEVYDKEGNIVKTLVSNSNGVAVAEEICVGTYTYKEVEAPEGYVLDNTVRTFTIEEEGIYEAVVYNVKEEIPKTGGVMSSDIQIMLAVSIISVLGYIVMLALRKKDEIEQY